MSSAANENIILPVSLEHIEPMMKIAECCNLAGWSYGDYLDEINRSDSFAYVYVNENYSENSRPIINTAGFIIMRLINIKDTSPVNLVLEDNNVVLEESLELEKVLERDFKESSTNIDFQSTEAEGEILNIAVLPSVQNRGVGQKLLDYAFGVCFQYKVRQVWLEVRKNNKTAIKFYRKNDFQVIYTRKNYYRNPVEDALVMKAELPVLQ